jgi:hypothetical protein
MQAKRAKRTGLVATNSIRGGANRRVLEPIAASAAIFDAWSDEGWTVEGAAVRVSLICFGEGKVDVRLDGSVAEQINSDLTATASDLTKSKILTECQGVSFQGVTKGAPFEVARAIAVTWLQCPLNPNGRSNSDVLRPIVSGGDIARSREANLVIDFTNCDEKTAALYQAPFQHVEELVKPIRLTNRRKLYRDRWWQFAEARTGLRRAIKARYLATPKCPVIGSLFGFNQQSSPTISLLPSRAMMTPALGY